MKTIGTVTIQPGVSMTETFEFAAWYRLHSLQPGTYPAIESANSHEAWAEVPSVVTAANLGSYYGGVSVGSDQASPQEVGKLSTFKIRLWRGYDDQTSTWNIK